ncbi:MAG: DUF5777 family beta-barrel protein, partial [Balneolales bacterium]|nr:DUF5777 family beta-barrel protein [Balneolales bacterium]
LFLIGSIAGMSTVTNLEARNLNSLIMYNFGTVDSGIEEFWGLDQGAAVRLGIDYGITDKLTVGIGRTSREDNVDLRFKYTLLRQLKSDKIPVEVALKGDIGTNTQENFSYEDFTLVERLNYLGAVMVARKFNERITLQVSPMISHFNTVEASEGAITPEHTHFALGVLGRFKLDERKSVSFEYLPVLGDRTDGTKNHLAFSYEIETGGHVFQMFLMSGVWFTEQHLIARNTNDFFEGEFRIGFNVNRVFNL